MLFDHAAGVFVLAQPDKLRMPNPTSGIIFHSGNGWPMAMDKLVQNVIRPAIEAVVLPWYGWHGF